MKISHFKNMNFHTFLFFAIIISSFVVFFKTAPIYYADSASYLNMELIRSAGYSVFVKLFSLVFGVHQIVVLTYFQFFLGVFGCVFLYQSIKETTNMNRWFLLILFACFISPLSYEIKVARSILSEGLAYPLLLFVVGFLFKALVKNQTTNFLFATFLSFVLILVRGQFLFLVPILLLVLLEVYNWKVNRTLIVLIVLILMIPFSAIFLDKIYHKLQHNRYVSTPWTGIQIIAMPYFLSDTDDYKTFKTQQQQNYFKYMYAKMQSKKLLLNQLEKDKDKIDFYSKNYILICNSILDKESVNFFSKDLPLDSIRVLNDHINSEMFFPLLKNNFSKCIDLYLRNLVRGCGTFYIFITYCIIFFISLSKYFNKDRGFIRFVILTLLLYCGNMLLVAIAEPTSNRYIFYFSWVLLFIILLLFDQQKNLLLNRRNEYY